MSLLSLATIIEDKRYQEAAGRTVRFFYGLASEHPAGHDSIIMALDDCLYSIETVILRGTAPTLREWRLVV